LQEIEGHLRNREVREAAARKAAEARFGDWFGSTAAVPSAGYRSWVTVRANEAKSAEGTVLRIEEDGAIRATGPNPRQDDYRVTVSPDQLPSGGRVTGWRLEVLPDPDLAGGKLSRGRSGEFILTNVKVFLRREGVSQVKDLALAGAVADVERDVKGRNYGKIRDTLDDDPRNGWTTEGFDPTRPHVAVFEFAEAVMVGPDEELVFVLLQRSTNGDANLARFRIAVTSERGETVRGLGESPMEEWARTVAAGQAVGEDLRKRLLAQFLLDDREHVAAARDLAEAKRQREEAKKAAGEVPVMVLAERAEPRPTHVLVRGVWDAKGESVEPGVPAAVLPWSGSGGARSRLDLADWLVSTENPLTARVVANHLWQLVFGAGLVRTPEDFGLQGEAPTHPGLLDWLAVELVESGWDLRHLLRLLVTSETYRQSSEVDEALRERDPENRLWARASRHRLPAWMIRDGALAASGLLNPAVGGPPVKPWQPPGVWEEIFMGRFTYQPSVGPARYRRTLYAYWRRSVAPTFLFDSAQRRVCEVRSGRTNTPLQALTLLNDETMREAARLLAERFPATQEMARRVLGRPLETEELAWVEGPRAEARRHYAASPEDAVAFATVGQQEPPPRDLAPELAAGMVAASILLNLDEAISHE
jgi:hypothetical protein